MLNYQYCARDATYTLRLGHLFEQRLEEQPDLNLLFWRLTMPGARAMEEIEMEGLTIDPVARKEAGLDLLSQKITLEYELNELIGQEINWDSPAQVGEVLYEDLGLPCKIFTPKKQKSTSEAALYHLQGKSDVVDKLLAYRTAAKLYNTYVKGWEDYRIGNTYYFDYKLHGTKTGRYSSPLHPIPRDGTIRNIITAPDGWTFLVADISQAELRTAAHLSRDTEMIRCFNEGIDIHWRTCMNTMETGTNEFSDLVAPTADALGHYPNSYSDAIETMLAAGPEACIKVEPRWYDGRYRSKATNFGYLFGMREKKYIEQCMKDYGFEPTMAEAKQARNAYFDLYAQLEGWHRKVKKLARLSGYTRTLTGRMRRLPGIQVKDNKIRAEAERQAVNSPVQGFIGDYKVMILIEVHRTFPRSKLRIVGEHHDALLIIVKNEWIDIYVPKILDIIKRPQLMKTFKIKLSVPMEGQAELGPWGKGVKFAA